MNCVGPEKSGPTLSSRHFSSRGKPLQQMVFAFNPKSRFGVAPQNQLASKQIRF